jgi:hypothetical protein
MNTQQSLAACALAFALSTSVSHAGPCSGEIDSTMAEFNRILDARAAAGPSAPQSSAATTHRQPTPGSVGAAESAVGDISAEQIDAVTAAMAKARQADAAGDQAACQQALADARRAAGR